jgi:hypothetical protein
MTTSKGPWTIRLVAARRHDRGRDIDYRGLGRDQRAPTAVYASKEPGPREQLPEPPAGRESREDIARDAFARAVAHGGEHVIKFADTAVEVFARTGHPDAIAAVLRAVELIVD